MGAFHIMKNIEHIIEGFKGRIFTVTFTKKDGTIRKMNCRMGVTKYLKGGKCTLDKNKYIIVFDMQNNAYRAVNKETILDIKGA